MHIHNIHCMIEKLAEVGKCEFDKGIENVDTKEMGDVAKIIKELSEAEYYAKISKAMDEAEDEEKRYYRGQMRDSRGRYVSRRGFEEKYPREEYRDMDREYGRMYYPDVTTHDSREGRSGMSRRSYMESKEMGKDKGEKMKDLEHYMKDLSEDISEMIQGATPEEKTMLKQKMQVLMQKF